jgi:integrase
VGKRLRNLLTDRAVRTARARHKAYRLADGGGLFLWVPPTGIKSWQFRYRHGGKPQTATLGKLSDKQGLAWAREKAEEARGRVEEGEHLTRVKALTKANKQAASETTFGSVSETWVACEAREARWTPDYREEVEASLRNHLEKLNALPVAEITAAFAAPHLKRVARNAPDMARKVRQRLRAIFDYAVENGYIAGNPLPAARRRRRGHDRKHLPAVLTKDGVGAVLRAAGRAEASKGVRRAHLLAAFTAQRVGEIVGAKWDEMDLNAGLWTIPRERMKRKDEERGPHQVPLPPVLLSLVKQWRHDDGPEATYVCPAPRGDGAITREAVEKFYRRCLSLARKHSPHSWRTVLSTWANDAGEDADAVEAQLDHATGDKTKSAYDRAKRLARRADLMAWHEQALIAARDGAEILAFKKAGS